ncbi:glycosyltransferase [Desulfovibrio sulfodismutans]|uniref:Glycosyltransferase n=1 Tax=Desulfolutivibrio sulfodismutans TaxID=63561 RepID=A0A7K3NKL8_9BACT|nr:glycosyltransferase [Desulfolutivibrio sulfodismutans]NDY56363.1 glycosyltransferase [Desulfolutivibrio sulfodismutans]
MTARVVLHVIDALNVGGAQELVLLLARQAPPGQKTVVCVLQPDLAMRERFLAAGAEVAALGRKRPSIFSPGRFLAYFLCGVRDVVRLSRRLKADVVQCHLGDAEIVGIVAGRLAGVRKTLVTVHNPILYHERPAGDPRNLLHRVSLAVLYRLAWRVVAVSRQTEHVLRRELGLAPPRLACVVNGVDVARFEAMVPSAAARRECGAGPDDFLILNIGRLEDQKRQDILLAALAEMAESQPRVRLCLAGAGSREDDLARMARELGVADRVRFLGARSDIPELLGAADMVAVASVWEGTSLSLMESMAAAKPIVATDIPGNRELLDPGQALLVPAGDVRAMARAIVALIADPAMARALGKAARDKARRFFDIRNVAAAYQAMWA